MEKGLWQICMHCWPVHAKVGIQKFLMLVVVGSIPQLFDPKLRNERFTLIFLWGFLQY